MDEATPEATPEVEAGASGFFSVGSSASKPGKESLTLDPAGAGDSLAASTLVTRSGNRRRVASLSNVLT